MQQLPTKNKNKEEEEKNGVKTDYTRGEKEGVDRTRVKSRATSVDTGQREGQGEKRKLSKQEASF